MNDWRHKISSKIHIKVSLQLFVYITAYVEGITLVLMKIPIF
jgi:hypothetical protein